jgi:hypothetical protein
MTAQRKVHFAMSWYRLSQCGRSGSTSADPDEVTCTACRSYNLKSLAKAAGPALTLVRDDTFPGVTLLAWTAMGMRPAQGSTFVKYVDSREYESAVETAYQRGLEAGKLARGTR